MTLKMRSGLPPFLRDENGHIPTTDETANWLVIVTRETLECVESPPDASLERLMQYAETFTAAAIRELELGRAGAEETIWLQRQDLVEYLADIDAASDR